MVGTLKSVAPMLTGNRAGLLEASAPQVGHCARIAAGSVVVKPVPHNVTVAGVPAKIVGEAGCAEPSRTMDQMLNAIGL